MTFKKLRSATAFRKELLPFIVSIEDHDILVAIGLANDLNEHVGYKQLRQLLSATPPTLQRRLRSLLENRCITRTKFSEDKRIVRYTLSRTTFLAYKKYFEKISE